ncbi:MAG: MFS transporter [Defluviitaleaceae bacterium]|nr:MFS transporter [Defluviitaleaceae bacterium]
MTQTKLWNRDFSLLITGQVVSIFGNMILSWALPLYILYISDSSALFGLVLAVPNISLLIMSPIGGIMADRLKKQRIMFWLDAVTTVIIVAYMVISGLFEAVVPIVIVKLLALNAIQGIYMPTVQAAIPALSPSDKLVSANAVTTVVNSLSNLVAPAAAGILFSQFGLFPILIIAAVCFAITTVMNLLIRIPFVKQPACKSIPELIKSDLTQAAKFAVKERPIMAKLAVIMFLLNMTIASTLMVGMPVIITQHLGMEMDMVGFSASFMMMGGLAGGILAGVLGKRLTMPKMWFIGLLVGLVIAPIGIALLLDLPNFATFVIITAASAVTLLIVQMFTIPVFAYIQKETPGELIGKVMSVIMMMPFLANAIGQLIYGIFFEQFAPWIVVVVSSGASVIIALLSRRHLKV